MERRTFFVSNGQGWELCLKRSSCPERLDRSRRPVVIVPGYGMNAFIFGYHPRGTSMIDAWVERGHEVWTTELRGQGASLRRGGSSDFGLAELALEDLRVALEFVNEHTDCRTDSVIGVGCSLGGSLLYAHVACLAEHRVGAIAALGAPMRFEAVHPFFRIITASPTVMRLVGRLSRREVNVRALPLIARFPSFISLYLHTGMVDLDHPERLFLAVDHLHPRLNAEFSHWIHSKDLVLRGCNVSQAFSRTTLPLLCVVGGGDGVVLEPTALSACCRPAEVPTEVLRVGDARHPYAHADLFVGNDAPRDVFLPIARWLETQAQQ